MPRFNGGGYVDAGQQDPAERNDIRDRVPGLQPAIQVNPLEQAARNVFRQEPVERHPVDYAETISEKKLKPFVNEFTRRLRQDALTLAYKAMAGTANKTPHDIVNCAKIFMDYVETP